ncbi:MAG TPA: SURF1 family cytochrome oxidase biogenesis protein, partial [Steroidobacteraceae bacterium]
MPVRIRFGNRVFSPSWTMTVLAIAFCALFVGLGRWQWERGNARAAQWAAFERGTDRVVPLGSRSLDELPRFLRVSATGRYDPEHQFLLDNRT